MITHAQYKAELLTLGCPEAKCSINCRAPKESKWLVFKRPKLPYYFQGKVFKDRVSDGEESYRVQEINIVNLLIPTYLGSTYLWAAIVNFFHMERVSVFVKQLKGYLS